MVLPDFIGELKRRNVFRVGAVYAVVGWLLIQIGGQIFPTFGAPDWVPKVFIVLVGLGFFIALIFAWAFELTHDGVKKTRAVAAGASITPATGRKLDFAIIGARALALGYFVWESRFTSAPDIADNGHIAEAQAAQASIAVLPFINMSSDPEQEYFSDGISEEILNVLAQIPNLHVTSRSSAFQFKGGNIDIPTVARQLGVANILEGSVRRSGTRVRITAQLIEAGSDRHLWSATYDRELTDVFAVQDEIAAAIVAALKQTLGIELAPAPQVKAAANPEAYTAYLLGQHLIRKRTKGDIEASIPNFERAIELDPDYAPAHAALGLAWRLLMADRQTYGDLTLEETLAKALPHVERALALDPELAEAHGIMGLTLEAQKKMEQAVTHYEQALRLNPSLTNVRNWYSAALASLGRAAEAFHGLETAYRLDPLSVLTGGNYANALRLRRRFDALEAVLERLEQIAPASAATYRGLALTAQRQAADGVITMLRGFDASPGNLRLKGFAAELSRSMGLGREALRLWPHPDGGWGIIKRGTDYQRTLAMARERYEGDPDNPIALADLAWAYFGAGNAEQAERMAARHLAKLGPAARPLAGTNWIAVYGAWARGDEATMLARLAPLEAATDATLEAGIDVARVHWTKAQSAFIRGQTDQAHDHARQALARGALYPNVIDLPYRHLGWDKIPRFQALRDGHEAYLAAERQKLLAVACGEDGFKSWQPLPETCS